MQGEIQSQLKSFTLPYADFGSCFVDFLCRIVFRQRIGCSGKHFVVRCELQAI